MIHHLEAMEGLVNRDDLDYSFRYIDGNKYIMNREFFNEKYKSSTTSQQELDRKWRCHLLEQEHLDFLQALSYSSMSASGGMNTGPSPTNCIEFTIDTTQGTHFLMALSSTEEPLTFTIDWGSGVIDTYETEGGYYELSHTFPSANTTYSVRVCFDDAEKILQLYFPN